MRTGFFAAGLLAITLLFAAAPAPAIWPFGDSQADKAGVLEAKGDAQLQAADEMWRAGDLNKASSLYQLTAETYHDVERLKPGFDNGLVRFRLSYCMGQVALINNTVAEKAKPEKRVTVIHPPANDGEALPEADVVNEPTPVAPVVAVDTRRELALAQSLLTTNHPENAFSPLMRVLKAEPDNRRALTMMAMLRMQQGRYNDAIVSIESLRGPSEDEAVLMLAAGAYCGAGRYFDALLALDKVLKMNPDLPQAHLNMAYLLLEMAPEKRSEADLYYQHALRMGVPRDAQLEKMLGKK